MVEFGSGLHQDVVDRYVAGENVEQDRLARAWLDTTQVSGIFSLPMYEEMLTAVRDVSATLAPERRAARMRAFQSIKTSRQPCPTPATRWSAPKKPSLIRYPRSTSTGSTFVARRAGPSAASTATMTIVPVITP